MKKATIILSSTANGEVSANRPKENKTSFTIWTFLLIFWSILLKLFKNIYIGKNISYTIWTFLCSFGGVFLKIFIIFFIMKNIALTIWTF